MASVCGSTEGPGAVEEEEEQGGRVDARQHLHQEAVDPADEEAEGPGLGEQVGRAQADVQAGLHQATQPHLGGRSGEEIRGEERWRMSGPGAGGGCS